MELGPDPLSGPFPAIAVRGVIALRNRLRALLDLAGPAELAMAERITGASSTMLVGTIAKLGVPDLLERGPLSPARIAESVGASPDAIHRAMRALALTGIFTRRSDGRYENNRLSRTLRRGEPSRMRDLAIYYASASNMRAWIELEHVLRTGENGFERAHGGKDVWAWFDENEHERETFAHAMMGMTTIEAPSIATLYPFAEVRTVCDVGGGRGTLLSEILIRHPHLRGILCDSNRVLGSARSLLGARGVADRVELAPGSFFESVPPGADAYLLKNILHDWDDERSIHILRKVRDAMLPGRKVLVCEALVEHDADDAIGAMSDVQMMVVCCEGRERGREEFRALFRASGFELGRVLEGGMGAVIEGIAT